MLKFHSCCGKNIELENNNLTAKRIQSFANALVFSQRPLEENEIFLIEIEKLEIGWAGNLRIGITFHNPSNISIPQYLFPDLHQLGQSYLFALKQSIEDPFNDIEEQNPRLYQAEQLNNVDLIERCSENSYSDEVNVNILCKEITISRVLFKPCDVGSRIGLFISSERELYFLVNGIQYGPCAKHIPKNINVYVALDLYGNTKQIKIINCYGRYF